ncbi:MAG: hypothetical protein U0Z44_02050 [Kouleothrix sp.]
MSITDLVGNPASCSEPATDETYTLDNTGPAATIDQAPGKPTRPIARRSALRLALVKP